MDLNKATKAEVIELLKNNQLAYEQELKQKQEEIAAKDKKIQESQLKISHLQSSKIDASQYEKKIEELEKLKHDAFNNEHTVRNELRQKEHQYESELQQKEQKYQSVFKENESLKQYVDSLALLFDETVKIFRDQSQILHTFDRNNTYVENYLLDKINRFNTVDDKKEKEKEK
jgi:chromosome segregation ATPase